MKFTRNFVCRLCVFYHFAIEGILMGIWSSFMPTIQENLSLTDTQLGSSELFVFFGTVIVTPVSAFCINNLGSANATYLGAFLMGWSLPFLALAPSFPLLIVAQFWYGWTMGIMDVSMNSCGILTELVEKCPLLGSYHGSYSIFAAIGSLIGAALAGIKVPTSTLFTIVSAIVCITSTIAWYNQYSTAEEKIIVASNKEHDPTEGSDANEITESLLSKKDDASSNEIATINDSTTIQSEKSLFWILVSLSCVGFLAAFGETGLVAWCVVYYDRYLSFASGVLHSIGFTAFMICMGLGRFSSDFLRMKYGRENIVKCSGILACSGLSLAMLIPMMFHIHEDSDSGSEQQKNGALILTTLCFALTGCGLSTLIPTMFSTAGHLSGDKSSSGSKIAIVAAFSYCGSIVSPPFIGVLSDGLHSLRYALLVVAFSMFFISPLGFGIPIEDRESSPQEIAQEDIGDETIVLGII